MLIRFAHLDRPLLHSQMRLHVLLVLPSTTASILQRTGGERAMAEAMAAPDTQREFEKAGYLVMPSACLADEIAPLRAELDAARSELTKGGYRIWTPATELPAALRSWSESRGLQLASRALPANAKLRCLGGAALVKTPGDLSVGMPFHQDEAYAAANHGGVASKSRNAGKHVCALWLALLHSDARSGCLRFVPSLGYALLPHERVSRDEAPSGFKHFLTRGSKAEAHAERDHVSVPVQPGDALVIGGKVVHGSHAAVDGERVAFSPLYEWEIDDGV